MTVGDRTIDVETVAGTFDIEGQQLDIRDLAAARPGTTLRANGGVALRGEASTVDISVSGSSEIESWWAAFSDEAGPVGHVEGTAHVTGLLSEPTITFETNGRSLAWSDVHVSTVRTTGGYGSGQLSLNTLALDIADGTVEGHGTIAVDDTRVRVASRRGGQKSMHARFQGPASSRKRSRRAARRSSNGAAKRRRHPHCSASAPRPVLSRPAGRPRSTCGGRSSRPLACRGGPS